MAYYPPIVRTIHQSQAHHEFSSNLNLDYDEEAININNIVYNIKDHLTTEKKYIFDDSLEKERKSFDPTFEINNIIDIDYDNEDNSTDYPIIDYIDLYKDTTNEYVTSTESHVVNTISHEATLIDNSNETKTYYNDSCPLGTTDDVTSVFSWIAAIFVKNGTNQFQYDCDGALLSTNIIVTAARCVNLTRAEDIVVILGKASLQNMKENEKILKISEVIVHENYTSSTNDIAVLKTEEVVDTTETILFACLSDGQEFTDAATTGWAVSGELTAIHFDKDKSQQCSAEDVCAVYGNDITVCPSFGGVYAVKQGGWYLHGIRTEIEPFHQSLCLNKPLHYTPLNLYTDWIYNL
ncbi:brain-specific serine protease 4-like [Pieris brassicae]|uniref:brain-specific serine protease 4-like n=1 Tax=Pieris brassicae TaxID=7116 RepID=UPI001E6619C2|nr:brain-specific serine protease 4-like [Pieris brassicae]